MSEKSDNNWEKFLIGAQDNDSVTNSPVTSVKPATTKNTGEPPFAETKRASNAPETLEEKIARVMAGINMPKKGGPPAPKHKTSLTLPAAQKSEDKVAVSSSPSTSEEMEDTHPLKLPAEIPAAQQVIAPAGGRPEPSPEPTSTSAAAILEKTELSSVLEVSPKENTPEETTTAVVTDDDLTPSAPVLLEEAEEEVDHDDDDEYGMWM